MPRKCRDYFTATEIARAFDVPADKVETVSGKKVYLNQIGDVREAVLSVHSKWIGNGFTGYNPLKGDTWNNKSVISLRGAQYPVKYTV